MKKIEILAIEKILSSRGIKTSDFQRSLRTTSQNWNNWKIRGIPEKWLFLIAEELKINVDEMVNISKLKYKNPKNKILGVNETNILNTPYTDPINTIPLISWVSAGMWCEAIDNYSTGDAEQWLSCANKCSTKTYALKVQGDSMTSTIPGAKTYPAGCIIYVDPEVEVNNGKRVIAKLLDKNEVTFKTYKEDAGKKWLMPINTQYEKILIDENVVICGVIIGKYEEE